MTDVGQSVHGPAALPGAQAPAVAPHMDGRHPQDPDPVRSTKAAAVLALGVAALVTGPVIGGLVPATIGLALAREARGDLIAARGYLTGSRKLRAGRMLALIGLGLAIAALVTATVLLLITMANGAAHDFPDTSD
jgi:(hydroxyamino)benzene mutase